MPQRYKIIVTKLLQNHFIIINARLKNIILGLYNC